MKVIVPGTFIVFSSALAAPQNFGLGDVMNIGQGLVEDLANNLGDQVENAQNLINDVANQVDNDLINNLANQVGNAQNLINDVVSETQNQISDLFSDNVWFGFDDILDGAAELKESHLFANIPQEKVPFDLSSINGLDDLTSKFIEHASDFDKTEIENLIDNLSSYDDIDEKIISVFDNSVEVLKGTHAFGKFFDGMKMMDLINDAVSVFAGISDSAKEALGDISLSDGYENFLTKLKDKREFFSAEDKELIVSNFEGLDATNADWGATLSRQVEIALDGTDSSPDSSSSAQRTEKVPL